MTRKGEKDMDMEQNYLDPERTMKYGSSALGECHNCRHFYPDNPGLLLRISTERKKAVDRDGEYLMQMIELVRRGLGYQEDIASAMLKLHADKSYKFRRRITKNAVKKSLILRQNSALFIFGFCL